MEEGYDITKDKVPVTPAQHYMMGGIKTDLYGRTSMAHLYAAGETACNGVHGKNRLASNSLLESLVLQSVRLTLSLMIKAKSLKIITRLTFRLILQRKKDKRSLKSSLWMK